MSLNPNYPVATEGLAPLYGVNTGATPQNDWVDLGDRTRHSVGIKRGRQYETDQMQAGEYTVTWDNTDGAFDPLNTAGPWYGLLKPYSPMKRLMQWPVSQNILTQEIADSGEAYPAGAIPSSFNMTTPTGSIPGSIATLGTGQAYHGTNVFSFAVGASATGTRSIFRFDSTPFRPGDTYTYSMWVANTTPSTSVQVIPYISWIKSDGTVQFGMGGVAQTINGASGTPGWTQLTVTATAPTTGAVYGMRLGLNTNAAVATACTLVVDAQQAEKAASASAWTYPGFEYPVFAGFVERWPTQWMDSGNRGEVNITGVDVFALLSQITLTDALTAEINGLNPRFVYKLADPVGSTVAADVTGKNPPAQLASGASGTGSLSFGNAITATNLTTGVYAGSGTVMRLNNPSTGATFLNLSSAGIIGPTNVNEFTRVLAFRYTGANPPMSINQLWTMTDPLGVNNNTSWNANLYLDGSGYLNWQINSPTNLISATNNTNFADGNWHLVIFGVDLANGNLILSVDGALGNANAGNGYVGAFWNVYTSAFALTGIVSDVIGVGYTPNTNTVSYQTTSCDLSYAAEIPGAITSAQITSLYSVWRNAAAGESTGSRYARILRYAGYQGGTWIDGGNTTNMGPANNLAGTDVMTALQAVVDTENGTHFVRQGGTIRFTSRSTRYNSLTPTLIFGENTAAGEIPYEDLQLDYDATHLGNVVEVTQNSGGQVFTATDATSIANYFPYTLTRTTNAANPLECQDAANYLLSRYKDPKVRITSLKINAAAYPGAFSSLLPLDLGSRIRVMRRPIGAPPIQLDQFVEHMEWTFDDQNNATLTMQCSPVDTKPYGLFSAWRGYLFNGVSAGVNTLQVSTTLDTTNPLAAQMWVGQQLTLDPGTANAETVTVQAVGTTSPGWSWGYVTLTANTINPHSVNAVVSEAMPNGVTDPTTWDAVSKFDTSNFAY